jgi:hypothetical protein
MSERELKIPPVEFKDGKPTWYPMARVSRTVPFGYKQDPEDDLVLLPVEEELFLLEVAKVYLKRYSSRQVAAWLTKESGREISHVGLLKRVKQEISRREKGGRLAGLKRQYEAVIEKEKRYQEKRIGGAETREIPKDYSFVDEYIRRQDPSRAKTSSD